MSKVVKPDIKQKKRQIISDEDYYKLKDFIVNNENSINERLTLGLFLFTGLSKQYIANMRNSQILFENGIFKLSFIKTGKNGNKIYSNTFITKALKDGNSIWEVSNLVLESVSNVAKKIDEDSEELFRRQTIILNSF